MVPGKKQKNGWRSELDALAMEKIAELSRGRSPGLTCGPGYPFAGHPRGHLVSASSRAYSCSTPNHGSESLALSITSLHANLVFEGRGFMFTMFPLSSTLAGS